MGVQLWGVSPIENRKSIKCVTSYTDAMKVVTYFGSERALPYSSYLVYANKTLYNIQNTSQKTLILDRVYLNVVFIFEYA